MGRDSGNCKLFVNRRTSPSWVCAVRSELCPEAFAAQRTMFSSPDPHLWGMVFLSAIQLEGTKPRSTLGTEFRLCGFR